MKQLFPGGVYQQVPNGVYPPHSKPVWAPLLNGGIWDGTDWDSCQVAPFDMSISNLKVEASEFMGPSRTNEMRIIVCPPGDKEFYDSGFNATLDGMVSKRAESVGRLTIPKYSMFALESFPIGGVSVAEYWWSCLTEPVAQPNLAFLPASIYLSELPGVYYASVSDGSNWIQKTESEGLSIMPCGFTILGAVIRSTLPPNTPPNTTAYIAVYPRINYEDYSIGLALTDSNSHAGVFDLNIHVNAGDIFTTKLILSKPDGGSLPCMGGGISYIIEPDVPGEFPILGGNYETPLQGISYHFPTRARHYADWENTFTKRRCGAQSGYTIEQIYGAVQVPTGIYGGRELNLLLNEVPSGLETTITDQVAIGSKDVLLNDWDRLTVMHEPIGTPVDSSLFWGLKVKENNGGTNMETTTITMDADKNITAVMEEDLPVSFILATSIIGQGTIDPAPGLHAYPEGQVVTVTATPAPGWHFKEWLIA